MTSGSIAAVVVGALLSAGCLGQSSAKGPTTSTKPTSTSVTSSSAPVLDAATRKRLLAEWRIAVKTGGSSGPSKLVFLTPKQLVPILNRINPGTPATTNLDATLSLDSRFVFVLPDSSSPRLDIATAAANGSYVHLIATGDHQPQFKFSPL